MTIGHQRVSIHALLFDWWSANCLYVITGHFERSDKSNSLDALHTHGHIRGKTIIFIHLDIEYRVYGGMDKGAVCGGVQEIGFRGKADKQQTSVSANTAPSVLHRQHTDHRGANNNLTFMYSSNWQKSKNYGPQRLLLTQTLRNQFD